jgi:dTDP-glucose 4,6-dehydratase
VSSLSEEAKKNFRFIQVSTDEVYGSLGKTGLFSEKTAYDPHSPYSATKAGADHLCQAYHSTYQIPIIITNCSNNFGPYQFPEKLIPLMILNALEGKALPIYGDGGNVRDWLYVEDHCQAIFLVFQRGECGEKYNIGSNNEKTNLQIVDRICSVLEDLAPAKGNSQLTSKNILSYKQLKTYVEDRPGHDRRYAIDSTKMKSKIGWTAQYSFDDALTKTVEWYLEHRDWCEAVQSGKYRRERLGTISKDKS